MQQHVRQLQCTNADGLSKVRPSETFLINLEMIEFASQQTVVPTTLVDAEVVLEGVVPTNEAPKDALGAGT